MLALFLIVLLLLLCLSGCSSSQKVRVLHILCVGPDGEVFHAEAVSGDQARAITDNWGFDACKVTVNDSDQS